MIVTPVSASEDSSEVVISAKLSDSSGDKVIYSFSFWAIYGEKFDVVPRVTSSNDQRYSRVVLCHLFDGFVFWWSPVV